MLLGSIITEQFKRELQRQGVQITEETTDKDKTEFKMSIMTEKPTSFILNFVKAEQYPTTASLQQAVP